MKHVTRRALLLLLTGLSLPGFADTPRTVTLTGDPWPPYVLGEVGGEATGGTGLELTRQIFDRIDNVDVRFPLVPWERALQEVRRGVKDGIFILLKTPEREQYMDYTDELFISQELIWYATERFPNGFEWQTFADLSPYVIGVVRGHSYGDAPDQALQSGAIKATSVTSADQLFTMLAHGRIDLAFANATVGRTLAKQYVLPDATNTIVDAKNALSTHVYYIAFSKKSSARHLIPAINKAISALKDEGTIEKIIRGSGE